MLEIRRKTLGFVSQFLRVIPRVSAVDVVAEPLRRRGIDPVEACQRAEFLLSKGALDMIADRRELRLKVARLLAMLQRQSADAVA